MEKIFRLTLNLLFLLALPYVSFAASLTLGPSVFSPKEGSIFVVNVNVSTPDKVMNAASGVLSYDPALLEVLSISKTGSIISLWAEEPVFDNLSGRLSFEGILHAPGYSGLSGKICAITFKAKTSGVTQLRFVSGSVLANDGYGENILSSMGPLSLTVAPAVKETKPLSQEKKIRTKEVGQTVGHALAISSETHPDEHSWYSNHSPLFSWVLPDGALEVKTLISKIDSRSPTVPYIPAISEKRAEKLVDGTHYFSLQVRTKEGWSPVSRYQVHIDTASPHDFDIRIVNEGRDKKIPPHIAFETIDQLSGISHYEVRIDDGAVMRTSSHDAQDPFAIPSLPPGGHTVLVSAFDKAGNVTQATLDFSVEAIPSPKIISIPSLVYGGEHVEIRGISSPLDTVFLRYSDGNELIHEESVSVGEDGSFVFPITRKIPNGPYIVSAYAVDRSSARSHETAPVILTLRPFYTNSSFVVFTFLGILLVVAIGSTVAMWYYTKHHGERVARVALMRIHYAEQEAEKAFDILREEIIERVALLKARKPKRKYTQEEVRFLETLETYLGEAKDVIVSDVRKVIEK
jgi:hypothetical protein